MTAWLKASRAMLLSVALGVLVGLLIPGVSSLGRSIGGTDTAQTAEAGAIGVLEGPATPSPEPEPDETEAPATQRPRTNTSTGPTTHVTAAPTDDGTVVIIATPHPADDSDVNEGDSHSSGSSSSDSSSDGDQHDDPPESEPEHTDEHSSGDEHCCN